MAIQPRWPRGAPDDEHGHGQGGRWAEAISARLPGGHLTGDSAMRAAGYQWADGGGRFDEQLADLWLHGHADLNTDAGVEPSRQLDQILQPSTAPIEVWRGIDLAWVPDGGEWVEPRYLATTVSPTVAAGYARAEGRGEGRPGLMVLRLPTGIGTAAIGGAPDEDDETWDITDLEDSGEIVVQRGLRLRETGRDTDPGSGLPVVYVEASPGSVPPGKGKLRGRRANTARWDHPLPNLWILGGGGPSMQHISLASSGPEDGRYVLSGPGGRVGVYDTLQQAMDAAG